MTHHHAFGYEQFRPWQRRFELAFWPLVMLINGLFNSINAQIDHPDLPAWEPWLWEWSSHLLTLSLIPLILAAMHRYPPELAHWQKRIVQHLGASVVFSAAHIAGMIGLRKLGYSLAGQHYNFGELWSGFGYEYLKDVRSYFSIVTTISLYQLWLLRLQGEARLLAAPDDGPPVEPIERPQRLLVRKQGRDFLINVGEIEWLQAYGNYVNLHLHGRIYPLRTTMAGIEARLNPSVFVRVHRSYLVNLKFLKEIKPLENGGARLYLGGENPIPCSRRYHERLRQHLRQPPPSAHRGG